MNIMFDFFYEITEFGSQISGLLNWGLGTINNFLATVSECQPLQTMIQMVNRCPAPFPMLFSAIFAAGLFDYVRGR